jgi:hypothetical protein
MDGYRSSREDQHGKLALGGLCSPYRLDGKSVMIMIQGLFYDLYWNIYASRREIDSWPCSFSGLCLCVGF